MANRHRANWQMAKRRNPVFSLSKSHRNVFRVMKTFKKNFILLTVIVGKDFKQTPIYSLSRAIFSCLSLNLMLSQLLEETSLGSVRCNFWVTSREFFAYIYT